MHKGGRLHFYIYWTYNCKRLERGSQALCTTITCSSSSHRIPERFFMPRQDEAYPVNSWSHPLTPFPGHDSFLDIQPEKSPRKSLQVKSVGISLLQPPVIKLSLILPTKKASRECWAWSPHQFIQHFPSGLGWAFARFCHGFAFPDKCFHAQPHLPRLSLFLQTSLPQDTELSPTHFCHLGGK